MPRLVLPAAATFALATALVLGACHGAPEPAADVPTTTPADLPWTAPPARAPMPLPEPPPVASVPPRFRGEWDGTLDACSHRSELRLRLGADRVAFHESSGPVLQARQRDFDLALVVRLGGEGETREARYTFRLADGGQRLIDIGGGGGVVRVRCL
jgi:hypothetical protein